MNQKKVRLNQNGRDCSNLNKVGWIEMVRLIYILLDQIIIFIVTKLVIIGILTKLIIIEICFITKCNFLLWLDFFWKNCNQSLDTYFNSIFYLRESISSIISSKFIVFANCCSLNNTYFPGKTNPTGCE